MASFDDRPTPGARASKTRLLTRKTLRLREVKGIVECHTACRVWSCVPRPPAHTSTLPDSPLEPCLVPKQRETSCSLIGQEELVEKGFVPHFLGHPSPSKSPRPGPLALSVSWGTTNDTSGYDSRLQCQPGPHPPGTLGREQGWVSGLQLSIVCSRPHPCVCALQLPINSPAPGCRGGPPSPVIWGEGGYYNSQNLKLRMNKSSVACHF